MGEDTWWYEAYIKKAMDRMKERGKTQYEAFAEKVVEWCKSHYYCDFLVTLYFPGDSLGRPGYFKTEVLEFDGSMMDFTWQNDWWEGEEGVDLCGFLPLDGIRIFGMGPGEGTTVEYHEPWKGRLWNTTSHF